MVAESLKKVKIWCVDNKGDLFIASIIFFTGLSGFGLGRLSVDLRQNQHLSIIQPNDQSPEETPILNRESTNDRMDKRVVAARSGTIYYYPWCSGAKRIKEENKIWFSTKEAAQQAGLKPASNCR